MLKCLDKVVGFALVLMLAALPVAACVVPSASMTSPERECCKKMAGECGRAGMAKSHSCCPPNGSIDNPPILKAASPISIHFSLSVLHFIQQTELLAPVSIPL